MPRKKASTSSSSESVGASLPPGKLNDHWVVGKALGSGAFSTVYEATLASESDDGEWALKVSPYVEEIISGGKRKRVSKKALQKANAGATLLFWEYNVYRAYLRGVVGVPSHPKGKAWYGKTNGFAHLAVERMHGGTLTSRCNSGGASPDAVCKVAAQLLETLQGIHSNGILFRDVKTDNFMLKNSDGSGRVYCLDFGAAVKYLDRTGKRRTEGTGVEGTPLFMGLRVHENSPPSPVDDLESLAYMLVWMLKGSLPWEGAKSINDVVKGKEAAIENPEKLYDGVDDSDGLRAVNEFMSAVIDMDADSTPDYERCISIFKSALPGKRSKSAPLLEASDWGSGSHGKKKKTAKAKAKKTSASPKKAKASRGRAKAKTKAKQKAATTTTTTTIKRSARTSSSSTTTKPVRSSRRLASKRAAATRVSRSPSPSRSKSPKRSRGAKKRKR